MTRKALPAKVSRPRVFEVVARERLFDALDAVRERPLIWLAAPPGAGKTSLVASYLDARAIPALWYQVDPRDQDPATLFLHLTDAAGATLGEAAATLPRFSGEHFADPSGFARLFFMALFSMAPETFVLALDNYQDAPDVTTLHSLIAEAVAQAPPGHSIIAISRGDPPAEFVQFAARGAIARLGWDSIRLSEAETVALCARRGVTEGWLVQALHRQAQGWAAGITLMLERLDHLDGKAGELPSETREAVFEYFASLFYTEAPDTTRRVLQSIAFLPRVSETTAIALSGIDTAADVLDALYRRRLFVDRRPGPEPTYQLHALLVSFLRMRTRQEFTPDAVADLLARSARSLEDEGDDDAAMELWAQASRWTEVMRLVRTHGAALLRTGRRETLTRWIEAVPETHRAADPWSYYWLGRAIVHTDPEGGTRILGEALAAFERRGDSAGSLECLASLVGSAFLGFHAIGTMESWVDRFVDTFATAPGFVSVTAELRICGVLCMTLLHARPWHPLLLPTYRRAVELLELCDDRAESLSSAVGPLVVAGLVGDFASGDRLAERVHSLCEDALASPSEAAWAWAQIGYLRFMEARYADSLDALSLAEQTARRHGLTSVLRAVLIWRSTVAWRVGKRSILEAGIAEIETLPTPTQSANLGMTTLLKARQAHARGRTADAASLTLRAMEECGRIGSRIHELTFGLTCADLLLELGRRDLAVEPIALARRIIERTPVFDCYRGALALLDERIVESTNATAPEAEVLRRALSTIREGQRRHYIRFTDWAMRAMLPAALAAGVEVELARGLVTTMRLPPPAKAPDTWPWPVRVWTLGRFEVEVDGRPLEFPRKLPRKSLLLLAMLIAHGGSDVPESVACDTLWPDEEGDAATNALSITVVRLRKLLGSSELVVQRGGRLSLDRERMWVDAYAFEQQLNESDSGPEQPLGLYRGAFIPDEPSEPWAVPMRERLRGRFIDALSRQGTLLREQDDIGRAIDLFQRGIAADPVVETFHIGLMRCYERQGRQLEAISAFRRMKQTLSVVLGVPPSEASTAYYVELLEGQLAQATGSVLRPDP